MCLIRPCDVKQKLDLYSPARVGGTVTINTMKTVTLTEAQLTETIATAVAQALSLAGVSASATKVNLKPATNTGKIAPKVSPKTPVVSPAKIAPKQVSQTADAVDSNTVEITVGTGKDKRIKLPARMFDKNNMARIDGTVYHGSESDGGRCKVQYSVFGAQVGDTIRITRSAGSNWTAEIVGASKRKPQAQAKVVPQATKVATKVAVKPTVKAVPAKVAVKPKVDNSAALAQLVEKAGEQALAGAHKGIDKGTKNFAEMDARRFMSSRDKKAFNEQVTRLGYKIADVVPMLVPYVFA